MRELTTNQKGLLTEAAIVKECIALGIPVARLLDDEPYDLILELPTGFVRLQCKSATKKGDVLVISCRRCRRGPGGFIRRPYAQGEIDMLAAYCAELNTCYVLPLSLSVDRTAVQLRLGPTRNNQHRLINWAKDYEFAARLSVYGPIAQLGERERGTLEAAGSSPAGSID
jgi:PD-(D/E)XK endonuclease